jgi:DNA-damage-inducible protein J
MMRTRERVATAPRTATFQMRINPQIRKRAESVYADCGLTLTEAINLFIQQSLNVEGLPFVVTPRSKAAKLEQAVGRLMSEINLGATSAERDGWVDESAILSEFGATR